VGAGYGSAWIGAFEYVLPAYESDAVSRETKASLSIKGPSAKEYLSVSLGESAEPNASVAGIRRDSASIRMALPLETAGISIVPYYSRSWVDQRTGSTGGLVQDAQAALGDFSGLPLLYQGIPFVELASSTTASDFSSQSMPSGYALPAANFTPETGLALSREYGSRWYDLVAPSALAFSYGRALSRTADQVTDAGIWSTTAKFASINLFGSMGAYPLGLPFDSDEYLSTLQTRIQTPHDGAITGFDLQFHGLASLYSGQSDKVDSDSKLSFTKTPGGLNWSCSLMLSLSRRLRRHWLMDLYSLAVKPAVPDSGKAETASLASHYLSDLATRDPILRSAVSVTGGLSGYSSDTSNYLPGWVFAESYEAKLTVPERLTLKVNASLGQSLIASTQVLTLGFQVGLTAVISF